MPTILGQVKNTIEQVIDRLSVMSSSADDQLDLGVAEELMECSLKLKAVLITLTNEETARGIINETET